MNIGRNVAQRLEEEISNMGAPPHGYQLPPLYEDMNDDQAPVDPPLTDNAIKVSLFQMV